MRREEGASGAFIAIVLVLVTLLFIAVAALNRTTNSSQEREQGLARLANAAGSLESFVSVSQRLPCPADPTANPETGVEVPNGSNCQFPEGTLPWKTIGMRRDDAYDPWGRKISYRVFSGGTGLTQAGGASMTNCDTLEAFPAGTTGTGLCNPVPNTSNPADRNTTPAQFLAGKGLTVTDMGVVHADAAYVLVSHGVTGLGGYNASGGRLDMPTSNGEKNNTKDTGPFTIQAFSNTDTGATDPAHFDDLLLYRSVADLAQRASLAARNWPDTILSAVTFDRNTVTAALGSNPASDTGQATIAFNNATVTGFDSGGNQDIAFVSGGGSTDGIGGVGGGSGLIGSAGGEGLRIDFPESARQFAFTVDSFDDVLVFWHERVEVRFYQLVGTTATLVATGTKASCSSNGKVESFTMDAGVNFNRVEMRATTTSNELGFPNFDSSFSLSEIRTCTSGVVCKTALEPTGDICSSKAFSPSSVGTADTSVLTVTLANNNSSAITGVSFTDAYPAGVVNAASPAPSTTCGGVVTASGGGSTLALTGGTVPGATSSGAGTCTVSANVTGASTGTFVNSTGSITTTNAGTLASLSATLNVLAHPVVAQSFNPSSVSRNTPSVLTVTLTNSNAAAISNVAFIDNYPSGLANAANPAAATTCGGLVTAAGNGASVTLAGGTIPASGSCTVIVSVTSAAAGTYGNALAAGAVTSDNAGANTSPANATLTVN